MAAIRGKHTKSTEVALRMALIRSKISGWRLHATDLLGRPDVFFPRQRVAIFVDGCFWHGCPKCGHVPKTRTSFWRAKILRNRARDRVNTRNLKLSNVKVIRIWEHSLSGREKTIRALVKISNALGEVAPKQGRPENRFDKAQDGRRSNRR
jgi:DNA mismatch endonuclease Vsr